MPYWLWYILHNADARGKFTHVINGRYVRMTGREKYAVWQADHDALNKIRARNTIWD